MEIIDLSSEACAFCHAPATAISVAGSSVCNEHEVVEMGSKGSIVDLTWLGGNAANMSAGPPGLSVQPPRTRSVGDLVEPTEGPSTVRNAVAVDGDGSAREYSLVPRLLQSADMGSASGNSGGAGADLKYDDSDDNNSARGSRKRGYFALAWDRFKRSRSLANRQAQPGASTSFESNELVASSDNYRALHAFDENDNVTHDEDEVNVLGVRFSESEDYFMVKESKLSSATEAISEDISLSPGQESISRLMLEPEDETSLVLGNGEGNHVGKGGKSEKRIDAAQNATPRAPGDSTLHDAIDLTTSVAMSEVLPLPVNTSDRPHSTRAGKMSEIASRDGANSVTSLPFHTGAAATSFGRRIRRKQPKVECIVCYGMGKLNKTAQCSEGHVMCKTCLVSYVTKTLMPNGTVFWDRIRCGGSDTCGYLFGPSVTQLLPKSVITDVEIRQMDVAYLVAGERDPRSNKWISSHSKDCPNCGVAIQKSTGCSHMKCILCRFDFYYTCDCHYPSHQEGCQRR